ncbi:YbaN family protein [Halomonas sp. YLGW01]|uniref:YbaN family protein n=1 Tax=Halomonas sp. YLGW01 TaxID=2773308 RepID=UPI001781A8D7|nr:YbaN family protein [Halomonas sp. YLGW01]
MSRSTARRIAYRLLALASFGLGVIGAFLPLMPTTCFMLVAVWAGSKGSPRFAAWIRRHPRFGPPLTAWERQRAIPRHAKRLAMLMLVFSIGALVISPLSGVIKLCVIVSLLGLALWIGTRPAPREAIPVYTIISPTLSPRVMPPISRRL